MKKLLLIIISIWLTVPALAQDRFSIEGYQEFLEEHKNMTADELLQEYPAGMFEENAITEYSDADYFDQVADKYNLTDYEKSRISKHGFVVTKRLSYESFHKALYDVFHKDLPVYVSADAILHALHASFDNELKSVEEKCLLPKIEMVLSKMHSEVKKYKGLSSADEYQKAVNDMDVYLTVARSMLENKDLKANFSENQETVDELLKYSNKEAAIDYRLFSSALRRVDFSQFKPRGHYTDSDKLKRYFRGMMWLGRTEIYITAPKNQDPYYKQKPEDIHRQNILLTLLADAAAKTGVVNDMLDIDEVLGALLGRQDNVNLQEVLDVMNDVGVDKPADLASKSVQEEFQSKLLELSSSKQLVNSQIIFSDIQKAEQVDPPAAFYFMGQRATIDGYITQQVVYDQIKFKGEKVPRLLPSTLDILFALGNDAAAQLLKPELEEYPYVANLAALRYLINGYEDDYWNSNCYTAWLNSIREMNPPENRKQLPEVFQTAAWWQRTMSSQLAQWSELRHDFLLYAKQPYTDGGVVCSFPHSYVDPYPETFKYAGKFAERMVEVELKVSEMCNRGWYEYFWKGFKNVCDTLETIARKEINAQPLNDRELHFLQSMMREPEQVCGATLNGWYVGLFLGQEIRKDSFERDMDKTKDYLVADVHTVPTDEWGNELGWVLHGGTGPVNLMILVTERPNGEKCTFAGPVASYFEYVTEGFERLTDEEWQTRYQEASRPSYVNKYIADERGREPGEYTQLFTIETDVEEKPQAGSDFNARNFPNPFANSTMIAFTVPPSLRNEKVEAAVYNSAGTKIKSLMNERLPANNYNIRWYGNDDNGNDVPTGVYIYKINIGGHTQTGKMNLVR